MSSYSEERFTTGSFGLDLIMDGGWKRGAINEVWGLPGSGKTMLMKQALQSRHIKDRVAMWVDTGPGTPLVKDPSLLYTTPVDAEQTFYLMDYAAAYGYRNAVPRFIIVDDANHLVRQAELEGNPDYKPHPQREYKEELWSLKDALVVNNVGVIFISQPRDNQRPPIRGTGISEQAAERISLKVIKQPQSGEILVQATRKATGYSTQYWVVPGKGIDRTRELIQYGLRTGIVEVEGSWYSCDRISRNTKWHGVQEFQDWLENTADKYVCSRLEERIAQKWAERTKE
jgi:RecA/RadA recombinase